MLDDERPIARTAMDAQEREFRSKLTRLVSGQGLIRGTILERERACGNPNCRCARGQKHRAVYLVVSEEGKPKQLFIPKQYEQRVRQWVANHQELKQLIRKISQVYWQKVKQRQG